VTVFNDTTPPTVAVTNPVGGGSVTGAVTVQATATDDTGVTSVQFVVDGVVIGTATTAPYALTWNTTTVADGVHTVNAIGRDAAGNQATSADVAVAVMNGGVH
jgi:hypothetical protein